MGTIRRRAVVALLLTILIGVTSPAAAQGVVVRQDLTADIDRIVSPYVAVGDFMGVVAVQQDGQAPVVLPYGLASVELGVPHRATDIFLIGSMSKQFTAVAILLLEQDGRLKTSDLVSNYLPDFKPDTLITIEQLLTHTAGVADVYSLERYSTTAGQGGSFADVVRDIGMMELTHQPGSAYAYSNGGYSVLAAIIERASGMAYGDYLAHRIFKPLGMESTSHAQAAPVVENRVPGYDPWGRSGLTPVVPPASAYLTGSGSLWSSAADLLTWSSALHGGRLLSATSYAKLTRDYGRGYGYGVSVFKRFGRDVVGHDGRVTGYASDVARYLEARTTVLILSNVQSVARDEIRRSVAAIVLGEPVAETETRVFADRAIDAAMPELVGVYSFGPGFEVSIRESNGRLLARANEGSDSELVPMTDGAWFSRVLYASVRFERDATGRVDRLRWGRGNQAPVGRRVR